MRLSICWLSCCSGVCGGCCGGWDPVGVDEGGLLPPLLPAGGVEALPPEVGVPLPLLAPPVAAFWATPAIATELSLSFFSRSATSARPDMSRKIFAVVSAVSAAVIPRRIWGAWRVDDVDQRLRERSRLQPSGCIGCGVTG